MLGGTLQDESRAAAAMSLKAQDMIEALTKRCGMCEEEAKQLVRATGR